jgi:hypothetical protein
MRLKPMTLPRSAYRLAASAAIAFSAACGDETAPTGDDHTPTSYKVLIEGTEASAPYTFVAGQTVRVQLKFFNAALEDLDDVESGHFAALRFSPASLATAAPVADHHFQFDGTGGTAGAGTVEIGYGHDAQADEHSFTADAATAQPAP